MRVFLIVLDSFGIGFSPDSKSYGDEGANTLNSISKSKYFSCDNLKKLGLFNIDGVNLPDEKNPIGSFARLRELSKGKDTTTGHWEMAGIVSKTALPTFPNGFPKEVIDEFEEKTGVGTLVNKAYSGTQVIKDYGDEHLKTGKLIVYTSADSVFQIAAHESIVPPEKLYEYCRIARKILKGKYGVGRVIARPFETKNGEFVRTSRRHDFSLEPPSETMLDLLNENGKKVIAVGKIYDIFAHRGIDEHYFTTCNTEGIKKTIELADTDFDGLLFTNLVDCDMLYGHRRDVDGYAKAISEFDLSLSELLMKMKDDDYLMITADHGCDPSFKGTDHTREYVELLIYNKNRELKNYNTIDGFTTVAKTICSLFKVENSFYGKALME